MNELLTPETQELPEVQEPQPARRRPKLPRLKKRGKILAGVLVIAVLAAAVLPRLGSSSAAAALPYQLSQAARQDLTVTVSGSATLEPADSYRVTTLVSGTIQEAPFEEDALVEEGALLYAMDAGAAQDSVDRANLSQKQAQVSYSQAQEALHPTSPISGVINDIYVHDGDSVSAGTALARIIGSTDLSMDFLFPYTDSSVFYVGQTATVWIGNFEAPVQGTVVSVSDDDIITTNGRTTSSVRVEMPNPGVVSDTYTARANIAGYSSYGTASITMADSATVYASGSGTITGFDKLVGSAVSAGETLCTVESESIRAQLENARLSLESAQLSTASASDTLEDYTITSPISGTVIEKNFKAGDKVDGVASGTLAVIYDLSSLKMEMSVSELDIGKVQVGQTVEITANALPGEVFTGTVERVGINGTTTDGFTNYPVTITLAEYGDLKPGMNVSATILCEKAENVLCVPVAAVARGDTVQVVPEAALSEDGTSLADPAQLEVRTVTLGRSDQDSIEITSGLEEGETVAYLDPALTGEMGG